jgi:hypothetical protein
MIDSVLSGHKPDFEKVMEHYVHELSGVRTGRANPALLNTVQVESYGSKMPHGALQMLPPVKLPFRPLGPLSRQHQRLSAAPWKQLEKMPGLCSRPNDLSAVDRMKFARVKKWIKVCKSFFVKEPWP